MTVKKVDGKWCVDVRLGAPGRRKERKRHLSPINTKKAALEYEKELVADSLSTSMSSANRNRRYEEFVLEFMTEHVLPRAKYSEIVSKDRILGNHLVPFFGAMKLHEINTASIDRFIAHQDRKGLKKKTVRNHLTVLRKSLSSLRFEQSGCRTSISRASGAGCSVVRYGKSPCDGESSALGNSQGPASAREGNGVMRRYGPPGRC